MKTTKTDQEQYPECRYNPGVVCWPGQRNCDTCGWEPGVAEARLSRYCSVHKIKNPSETEKNDKNS